MKQEKFSAESLILRAKHNSLFKHFPTDNALYCSDVAEVMPRILARYGVAEWQAAVIALELHGHVGLYAMLGVKMGSRALELLDVGRGDVTVRSFAGLTPPFSCLNDGLQASTGATLGHGSIVVEPSQVPHVEALFTAGEKSLRLTLKRDVVQLIDDELRDLIRRVGSDTSEYWAAVRALAIDKWVRFDRRSIFDEIEERA